jgi:uncharacterized RDD family membrane protein YckC
MLSAWAIDLLLLASMFAADVLAATHVGAARNWSDALAGAAWLWVAWAAVLAVAWSWVFVACCGRTPGMAATRVRVQAAEGGRPTPMRALVRAVLAVACAAPGLFGFVLALFDARGQMLHDKLCRCVTVVD